ncbi:hypothetical protein IID10_06345 [candidate division KSB1 bacterium]|nr:hypothetical protein [candidate division KSB1 bacterium]TDI96891.1 MAG: hypothetical protein E2O76_10835 [Caldithrix sp.]
MFWFGLVTDTIGTGQMKAYAGHLDLNLHTILGLDRIRDFYYVIAHPHIRKAKKTACAALG